MNDLFDSLGNQLYDIIDNHENNNVGWMLKQFALVKGFDEGGVVDDSIESGGGTLGVIGKAVGKTLKQDTSALGGNFVNSPTYLAQHYTQAGKFFTGAEQGNKYTDHFQTPEKTKSPTSENPTDFYARWYNRMREFAEASEVANRGQTTVRGV